MKANGLIRRLMLAALCGLLALVMPACDDSSGPAQRGAGDGAVAAQDKPARARGAELGAAPAAAAEQAADDAAVAEAPADAPPADEPPKPDTLAADTQPKPDTAAPDVQASPDQPDRTADATSPAADDAKPAASDPATAAAPAVTAPPAETVVEVAGADGPGVAAPAEHSDPAPAEAEGVQVAIAPPSDSPKPRREIRSGPAGGQGAEPLPDHLLSPPLPSVPKVDGYQAVSFDKLAGFAYYVDVPEGFEGGFGPGSADPATAPGATDPDAPDATELAKKGDDQMPAEVKALNEKKIAIVGYMVPIDFEQGKTNEFVLIRVIPSCFFCQPSMVNEWIEVKTKDNKRFPYNGDDPLLITGVLSVGAEKKDGFVTSVYRMEADNVEVVQIK